MTTADKVLTAITVISIPTVMFGGFSLLRLRSAKRLTEFQAAFFRAGHAHAGVLLVMTLASLGVAARLSLSQPLTWVVGTLLLAGSLAQSGGMFIHMGIGRPDQWSWGNTVTTLGAVLLAVGLGILAYGVIAA